MYKIDIGLFSFYVVATSIEKAINIAQDKVKRNGPGLGLSWNENEKPPVVSTATIIAQEDGLLVQGPVYKRPCRFCL